MTGATIATRQPTLFAGETRLVYDDAIRLTLASMREYGPQHDTWAFAWSGGKDSSATLTVILHLLETGQLAAPRRVVVFYGDTRMELVPLAVAAKRIMAQLAERSIECRVVMAPLDERFLVYMLGRGVPPPNNRTLRWCTSQIKVEPMQRALEQSLAQVDGSVLMITGVRQGESAVRDGRIVMSCSRDGAECGQGWYQRSLPQAKGIRGRIATLAPLLHWRVCNVWDWLRIYGPMPDYGGWATAPIADAYGGDEAEEVAARTGCVGCPLASQEKALDMIIRHPGWTYLAPLKGLKPLYAELREARHRLRQPGGERRKDGTLAANQNRMGPLTMEARMMALERVVTIQSECNTAAVAAGRPLVDIINPEEIDRIGELICRGTWPRGWTGSEPRADEPYDAVFDDGTVQPLLVIPP